MCVDFWPMTGHGCVWTVGHTMLIFLKNISSRTSACHPRNFCITLFQLFSCLDQPDWRTPLLCRHLVHFSTLSVSVNTSDCRAKTHTNFDIKLVFATLVQLVKVKSHTIKETASNKLNVNQSVLISLTKQLSNKLSRIAS